MRRDQENHEKYAIAVPKFVYKKVYSSQKEESNSPQICFKHNRIYLTQISQKKKEGEIEVQKKKSKLSYIPNKESTGEKARKTTQ